MDLNWWAFIGVVAVAYLIPGPDMAVILRSATRGSRPGVAAAAGAQLGLCAHMLAAVIGLSVVLARYPELLTAIRIAGGLYLLFLGGRLILPTLRRPSPTPTLAEEAPVRSAFNQGLLTNLLNPKAVLFFAAVLPQFLTSGPVPVWVQIVALGVFDILLGFVAWAFVIALGVGLSDLLRRQQVRRWWDRVTGAVLASVGGGLVLPR